MRAGKLRNRASIERRGATSQDDFGNPVSGDWVEQVSARPCSIMPLSGREQEIADRLESVVRYRVIFRYSAAVKAVNAGDSLLLSCASADLDAGARLNIKHDPTDPTGRRAYLEFIATFGEAAG